MNIFIRSSCYP